MPMVPTKSAMLLIALCLLFTCGITGCQKSRSSAVPTPPPTVATTPATTTPPIANAMVSDTLTCFQDTIKLTSTGSSAGNNIAYAWTTMTGHFISGQNTATALVDTTGFYILNVTNTSIGGTRQLRSGWGATYPRVIGDAGLGLEPSDSNVDALYIQTGGNIGIGTIAP